LFINLGEFGIAKGTTNQDKKNIEVDVQGDSGSQCGISIEIKALWVIVSKLLL
jgi:hypothetical protein